MSSRLAVRLPDMLFFFAIERLKSPVTTIETVLLAMQMSVKNASDPIASCCARFPVLDARWANPLMTPAIH